MLLICRVHATLPAVSVDWARQMSLSVGRCRLHGADKRPRSLDTEPACCVGLCVAVTRRRRLYLVQVEAALHVGGRFKPMDTARAAKISERRIVRLADWFNYRWLIGARLNASGFSERRVCLPVVRLQTAHFIYKQLLPTLYVHARVRSVT